MALQSMTALASITLQQGSAFVTFSNIPQNYRDLIIEFSGTLSGNNGMNVRFNGDTGSNYLRVVMVGTGSTTASAASSSADFMEGGTVVSTAVLNIMDYSATDKHKTVIGRNGPANNIVAGNVGRWANTAAINSITISPVNQTILSGSTFDLYGRIA